MNSHLAMLLHYMLAQVSAGESHEQNDGMQAALYACCLDRLCKLVHTKSTPHHETTSRIAMATEQLNSVL